MTTYSAILDIPRDTIAYLANLLRQHRLAVGTRAGRRALSVGKQAVLVLRWFLDNTRLVQLRRANAIGRSTAYTYLHEAIKVLAAQAPDLHTALEAAKQAGYTHLNTVVTVLLAPTANNNRNAAIEPRGDKVATSHTRQTMTMP